jgi:hypothetical protein
VATHILSRHDALIERTLGESPGGQLFGKIIIPSEIKHEMLSFYGAIAERSS